MGILKMRKKNLHRCQGVLCASLISFFLAIPFFVAFGVLFSEGKNDWEDNGRGILLPGDLYMWFGLIMLLFGFIFGIGYYSMTIEAKIYPEEMSQGKINRAYLKD